MDITPVQIVLGAASLGGLFVGGRVVVKNLASGIAKGAASAATLLVFWTAVAYAFKFVIEN